MKNNYVCDTHTIHMNILKMCMSDFVFYNINTCIMFVCLLLLLSTVKCQGGPWASNFVHLPYKLYLFYTFYNIVLCIFCLGGEVLMDRSIPFFLVDSQCEPPNPLAIYFDETPWSRKLFVAKVEFFTFKAVSIIFCQISENILRPILLFL